ncbi:MAG: ROK family transcriptional regulator [Anaerolineae bacterium]|nr:ROK family transcriptional regulator [Anaerolineae bacterium]
MRSTPQKATREQTRLYNSRLVLKLIYDHGQISRAEVARLTHLTRTTVSEVVEALIRDGLVEEVGVGPSAGGKPPILLNVKDDARHLIGVDLASGEFRGGVVNLRGEILHRIALPLHSQDGDRALALVYRLMDELRALVTSPLLGIGIGTPGLMDPLNGVVRRAVNLDWQDLPLRDLLQARYGVPVYVANDCQVAAMAEYLFGKNKEEDNLVLVKIGQGIGAGIVLHGRLFYGDTFGAGEIGHIAVVENGERCRCGNRGCLETVASESAIIRRARAVAYADQGSLLRRLAPTPDEITLQTVCQAVEAGDEAARHIVLEAGRYIGFALAQIASVLSVRRILLAGSVTCFGQAWLDVVREEIARRSLSLIARDVEIGMSHMGEDIVILGASALVLASELGLFTPIAG